MITIMKQTILLFALVVFVGLPCHAAQKTAPKLRAGAATVDITPQEYPLSVPGLFTPRMADSAHDPLHARALVLDDGTTALAMVVVDNIGVPQEVIDEAKAIASKQCGIAVEKMLVSSTHTHTGPPANVKSGPAPAIAYREGCFGRDRGIDRSRACRTASRCPGRWDKSPCLIRSSIAGGISSRARCRPIRSAELTR